MQQSRLSILIGVEGGGLSIHIGMWGGIKAIEALNSLQSACLFFALWIRSQDY